MNIIKTGLIIILMIQISNTFGQNSGFNQSQSGLWHNQERTLRYLPDGTDFVITNGNRLFTRAIYGTHTAFRVETGDKPEFALYMPGMGGNFKLGITHNGNNIWLNDAKNIEARYRAGARIYTIKDPVLGNAKLHLHILALADAEGFILKVTAEDLEIPVQLIIAFGGATGKKFSRDGDMGPDPASSFFLKPENCKDNIFAINKTSFTLKYGAGLPVGDDGRYFIEDIKATSKTAKEQVLVGFFPQGMELKIADATKLNQPFSFFQSPSSKTPALAGKLQLKKNQDYYFTIYRPDDKELAQANAIEFNKAEAARVSVADRIKINTPDPFINTIGGTLAIAADANWESPSYMHGAIGWRMRLNGWRGAYMADALGWHDRAKIHLESYAQSQVKSPDFGPVLADTTTHLSRSLEKLGFGMFSKGYISRDPLGKSLRAHHYDMNLVYIDILLRHYLWNGDLNFMKETWPVLKDHLAWEIRNFDPDRDGLYDAYAAIWASDALQYSGGGVAHSSAYNYFANKKAAEIAVLLGEDPKPYRLEAEKILNAMNAILWMKKKGSFAEFKDAMGNKLIHPSAALWTIYHSMDSETMDPFQAYQSMKYIDNEIPHIPIKAKGLEENNYYTLSTTNWMPYTWSLNNVALAESMHTILANWQAGRNEEAYHLFKSEILASMYLGGSPGGVVQISHYDAIRGEAYRDFADPVGMFSRALIEGLFGILPDALNHQVTIKPGFPSNWNFASFSTPDVSFDFKRVSKTDIYKIIPKFPEALNLKFQIEAQGQVKSLTVNGKPVKWLNLNQSVGKPMLEISTEAAKSYQINIVWEGNQPVSTIEQKIDVAESLVTHNFKDAKALKFYDPQEVFKEVNITSTGFSGKLNAETGNYTAFVQLAQGDLSWWMPIDFKIVKAISFIHPNQKESNQQSFKIQNNTKADLALSISVNKYKTSVLVPSGKTSDEIVVPITYLISGTNKVDILLPNGTVISHQLINWAVNTPNENLEKIDLSAHFNDQVTQIFKNKYLSPRPQVTTLQLPWQGTGDWPRPLETHVIDDSGLRKLAGVNNSIVLPQGLVFSTPSESNQKNILFTSQWDNYPKEVQIPLNGKAAHVYLMMAGSTNPMQSQLENGIVEVEYMDGTKTQLFLRNPETWWPIEEDYYTDGFAFSLQQPRPIRVHLKTGAIVSGEDSKAKFNGREIEGGAATILDLPLDSAKVLKNITLKTIANDVVIGLMAVTLLRD